MAAAMTMRRVEQDGLVHVVEVDRITTQGDLYEMFETWLLCESEMYRWPDPPFRTGPVTCLFCAVAQ